MGWPIIVHSFSLGRQVTSDRSWLLRWGGPPIVPFVVLVPKVCGDHYCLTCYICWNFFDCSWQVLLGCLTKWMVSLLLVMPTQCFWRAQTFPLLLICRYLYLTHHIVPQLINVFCCSLVTCSSSRIELAILGFITWWCMRETTLFSNPTMTLTWILSTTTVSW
jgi:hypothetical protein